MSAFGVKTMNLETLIKGFGLLIGLGYFSLFSYVPALFGACDPVPNGGLSNSGTVSGVGSGSVGTQVGIGDNTVDTKTPQATGADTASGGETTKTPKPPQGEQTYSTGPAGGTAEQGPPVGGPPGSTPGGKDWATSWDGRETDRNKDVQGRGGSSPYPGGYGTGSGPYPGGQPGGYGGGYPGQPGGYGGTSGGQTGISRCFSDADCKAQYRSDGFYCDKRSGLCVKSSSGQTGTSSQPPTTGGGGSTPSGLSGG
jgi:hypothetical protein